MTVTLYHKKRRVELTLSGGHGVTNWNLPMNTNDFRLFRDAFNNVEFVIRDTDRRPINLMDRKLYLIVYDFRTDQKLKTWELKVTDEQRGLARLMLADQAIKDWLLQDYAYEVMVTEPDGSFHMLYTDTSFCQKGFFQISRGPELDPSPSWEFIYSQLTPVAAENNDVRVAYRSTGAVAGSLQNHSATGLHTISARLENFTGSLVIQGSTESGVPTDNQWFHIETHEFNHDTSTRGYTVVANLNWIRILVYNDNDQQPNGPTAGDLGRVEKLVIRT